jgi:uncharacterized protein (TIGR02145 family)
MKTKLLTGLIILLPFLGLSQKEFNNWYFGDSAGVSFNSGFPVTFLSSQMPDFESGTSNISDSLGNILFYTNGLVVNNRNNVIMPNGNLWVGCGLDYIKQNIAFQNVADPNRYYLFVAGCDCDPGNTGLTYSVIDMTLDGGLGDVPSGLNTVPVPGATQASLAVTAARHHNNRDVWVVVRLQSTANNNYLSYLINPSGINFTPVVSNSHEMTPDCPDNIVIKSLKISRDGTKLASVYDTTIEFCNFNSSTGQITPLFLLNLPRCSGYPVFPNSVEFSVNSKYLYISLEGGSGCTSRFFLYQYDATITDSVQFMNSGTLIVNEKRGHGLQLAPDGKIYCSINYSSGGNTVLVDSLCVINHPSSPGTACNYQPNILSLEGRGSGYALPDYVERYYAVVYDTGQCLQPLVRFSSTIWPKADSIHWDFGDPASGPVNFSVLPDPSHTYPGTGQYTAELYVRHHDNRTDTTWKVVNILLKPNVGPDQTICIGDSTTFDAGLCSGCTYQWKNLGTNLIVGTGQTYKTGLADSYSVTVINSNNCSGSDTVQLFTTPVPSVTNNPLSKSICSGDSTHIILTSNVAGTVFHWTASLTSGNITGFSADSGHIINQVLINSLSTSGIVTYHITPIVGSCVGTPVNFPVTVTPGDSVKVSITASTNNVCAGTQVTFTATPTNPGANPIYQWKVNSINAGTNSPVFTYIPANGDLVSCLLTSSATCTTNNPASSIQYPESVNPNLPVSVTIIPSQNPLCAGNTVTFTATPTNGGVSPIYQWKVNGINAGTNSSTYSYVPTNGDLVSCILTSSETCTTGNPASSIQYPVSVDPNLPVSITIVASANPFCQGSSVSFTATPVNEGALPIYQWKVNGVNSGTNSPTFTYNPLSGDLVSCILTSSIPCPINNPITSNTLLMTVNNNLPASVTITPSSNPFCPGSSVTFNATPINGGTTPAYQWKVNGVNAGTNSHIFTYNPANNDSIRCIMTSNLGCVTGNPASSAEIIMSGTLAPIVTFASCFDTITTVNAKPIKLKGGIPLGGTYSGPGVNSLTGIFNPATAGVGTKTITYAYTNAALCTASKSISILNLPSSIFTCGNNLTDIRDNQVYKTVQIGSQCWMAEDLNYGTEIPITQDQRDNCIPEKYHNPASIIQHPASVYQWDELMQYDNTPADQGFCPPAWHIPTENDWNTLFAHYINNGFAGSPLKYSGYSGFNALLSGARNIDKSWDFQGFATFFWSSTSYGGIKAWAHGMNDPDPSVSVYPASRANAFSVRCVHD